MKNNAFACTLIAFFSLNFTSHANELLAEPQRTKQLRSPGIKAKHFEVSIHGGNIKINKADVRLGEPISVWKTALGGTPRCFSEKNNLTTCVWDDYGIEIGSSRSDTTRVKFLNIKLAWDKSAAALERPEWFPKNFFQGSINLDGFSFNGATEFRQIGHHAHPERDLTCGGRYCGRPRGKLNDVATLTFSLDSATDRGHVVEMSMSCPDVTACAALIPSSPHQATMR